MSGIKDLDQELINATRDILAKKDRIGITDQDRYKRAVLGDEDEETVPELGKAAKIYQEMTPGQSVEVEEAKKKKVIGLRTPEKVKINPVVEASTIYQGIPNGEQGDIRVAELISYLGSRGHKHGQDFWWENGLNVNNAPVGLDIVKSLKAWNPKKYKDAAMDGNVIKWNTGPSSARAGARPSDQTETKKAPLEWGTDASVNAYKNMTPGEPTDEGNRVIQATIDAAKKRTVLANKKNPKHHSSPEYIAKRKKRNREFPDDIHRILTQVPPKTDAGRKWQAAYKQSLALNNSFIPEEAPPGDKAERFIRKNKADFKERYGENWERVLYATAWKNFGESIEEAVSVDGRTKGYRAAVARIAARNERISQAQVEPKSDEQQSDDVDVQQTDEGNRLIGATIKQGEKNVAAAKEAKRKAAHTAMVNRLHAASGTKPNKPLRKSNQRGSTRTIKYNTSPEELSKSFRYDTLTGNKRWGESVEEGTNAQERGEVQSPRSEEEYDALSPADKKIVDKRIRNAFKQSISRQPGESPRNKRKKMGESIEEDAGLRAILDHPSHRKSAKKVRGGDSLSKPEHKRLASAVIGHLAKNKPGHLKRSGDHYEAGEEAIDDLNSSYSPNHGESIEEDRRGETFEVKYAMSKKGPIKVSKFNSHSDAHKFLDQVKKQGFKGMVVSPNFSKGVDRKTESVDFDEGAARDREERVYGSKASQDMNWGVEPEDANTKRSRKNFERQQLAKARAAAAKVGIPKAGTPEWFAWKRRQKQQNSEYVPEAASKPAPPLPKGMTQKDLEKLTPKQRAKIRSLAGKKEYPHAHRDSNDDGDLDEARSPKEQAEFEKQMKAFVKKGSVKKLKTRGVPKKAPQTRVRGTRPRPSSAGAESKIRREEVIDEKDQSPAEKAYRTARKAERAKGGPQFGTGRGGGQGSPGGDYEIGRTERSASDTKRPKTTQGLYGAPRKKQPGPSDPGGGGISPAIAQHRSNRNKGDSAAATLNIRKRRAAASRAKLVRRHGSTIGQENSEYVPDYEEHIDEGGIGSIYPKDKPLRSPTAKAVAKRLSKQRADLRKKLEKKREEVEEGSTPKKRPMSDAQKARHEKHQKLLKITGAKRSKAPRKKARGKTEISKIAGRYAEYTPDHGENLGEVKKKVPHWTEREQEAIATERRLAGITPAKERELQRLALKISKQQRKQEGKKKKEKVEVEVSERINPTKNNPRRALEIKKRNNAHKRYLETTGSKSKRLGVRYTESVSVDEMQKGSKHSVIEPDTESSFLNYRTGSKRRGGPTSVGRKSNSSKDDKRRVSRETRRRRKQRGMRESRVSITPEREAEIKKEVQADIEKRRQAKKARDKKAGRYMDHWGNWRTTGKPNPADELTQDFNKESIDKEELKRLMHKKDLDNRHRRKAERAAERTAKTKRKFGPNKPSETAMARAMRIAQKKKRKK